MIYDAHIHNKNLEAGGFLIGLEGIPKFNESVLSNAEAMAFHSPEQHYIAFYYVTYSECNNVIPSHKYLKYHPKREKYTPIQVIESIRENTPKCVILDTLNEPYWQPNDYWHVARQFPDIPVILAHAGGYSINEFVKICHLQHNVWIDFSLTQKTLGCYGDSERGLPYIDQAIRYALQSPFKNRILLSSDYPFFSQEEAFQYYSKYITQLNENFLALFDRIIM